MCAQSTHRWEISLSFDESGIKNGSIICGQLALKRLTHMYPSYCPSGHFRWKIMTNLFGSPVAYETQKRPNKTKSCIEFVHLRKTFNPCISKELFIELVFSTFVTKNGPKASVAKSLKKPIEFWKNGQIIVKSNDPNAIDNGCIFSENQKTNCHARVPYATGR